MKKIFAIAWKDTLTRFTGFTEWLFFLILPIIFTVVLAGGTGGSADNRVRLVVVDQANSSLSANLVAALEKSAAVRPEVLTLAQADSQFSQRRASAMLVIPAEFDLAHLEQGSLQLDLRQLPNNMNAVIAERAVLAVISRVSSASDIAKSSVAAAEAIQPFATSSDRQAYFDAALTKAQSMIAAAPDRIAAAQGNTVDQVEYDPRANSSAGQLITWVFVPLLGI
jgi:ABC-2 type transport system permease protein